MRNKSKTKIYVLGMIASIALSSPTPSGHAFQAPAIPNWTRVTAGGEEFSVELPVLPAMSTTDMLYERYRTRKERVIGAYAEGVAYAIHAYENPERRQSLGEFVDQRARMPSVGQFQKELTKNGFAGKQYSFTKDDLTGVTQFFATDRHLYIFTAVGAGLSQPEPRIARFFESIKLGGKAGGESLKDGPGSEGVDEPLPPADIFPGRLVTRRAFVLTRPEPRYTEEARRHAVTGSVFIRCVFSASGEVREIQSLAKLPNGLTERAMAAAKQMKFVPATKDGRFVSMWIQLQYNFNLY